MFAIGGGAEGVPTGAGGRVFGITGDPVGFDVVATLGNTGHVGQAGRLPPSSAF